MSKETTHLESLGHIAVLASAPVSKVQEIIAEVGAVPRFTINGIPHFEAAVAGTVIARANGWTNQPAYYRRFDAEIQA